MPHTVIHSSEAPGAIGPYSQAIATAASTSRLVYTAGQVGLSPATGQMVEGGVEPQARQALANLMAILRSAGAEAASVVKTTIFLVDMADFEVVNKVYGEVFAAHKPARSTVAVVALPRHARVEIEAVAALE